MLCVFVIQPSIERKRPSIVTDSVAAVCRNNTVCRNGYYIQLRQIRPVTASLSADAANTLVQAFISSRLDYCNALLHGISDGLMHRQ